MNASFPREADGDDPFRPGSGIAPLHTERLDLVPASLEALRAAAVDRDALARLLDVDVAEGWPSSELDEALPSYIAELQRGTATPGWGLWLLIDRDERVLVGDVGFKGRPNSRGEVEIGYGIAPAYRRRGYASEASRTLCDWAFSQPEVARIVAECLPENVPSVRVLQRLGMRQTHKEGKMLKWELSRPS